jgi:NADPH-dependent 2,4-dienoyl-CoA reductase/sulfur reductase-like enzyme/Pyruvate/2-oxoacid:ferredoxin oxidoreductase delta subunit/bacterioferritin-associated ferredoxin
MSRRIHNHPILAPLEAPTVPFYFNGKPLEARRGETIATALYANGIRIFGRHFRDDAPQGIFCANGQCSQCLVIADGRPVKSCMVEVTAGMRVEPARDKPVLPAADQPPADFASPAVVDVDVLVVGGGPSGICATAELGRTGARCLIIDDKAELGGKLSLQTHAFFGSIRACHAGTRGIDLTDKLATDLPRLENVDVWLRATAVGVYGDGLVGVVRADQYVLVRPKVLLIAAGAREKSLSFPGCDLPGIYGAGAFQTLVNRDRVRAAKRLFIVGGGNVGLIAGYHALQASIQVVGLVEALPQVGGYKVHLDKLRRLGVPMWTSHTVLRAEGKAALERVVIAKLDDRFEPIAGTERTFAVDTLLIAVGLAPVDELIAKAEQADIPVFSAGDANEIAEASAAIFSGRITGRRIAAHLGRPLPIPAAWEKTAAVLKSRPGRTFPHVPKDPGLKVFPIIACNQEIPCNPCTQVCPLGSITIGDGTITSPPRFAGGCLGCGRCVMICPGLAIRLVLESFQPGRAHLILPWEMGPQTLSPGDEVVTVDMEGKPVGRGTVRAFRQRPDQDRRTLVLLDVPAEDRLTVAGFRIQQPESGERPERRGAAAQQADPIVCRCERVRKSTIVEAIRAGIRDLNVLKAVTRASMGGCGGRTCTDLIRRIMKEEGVSLEAVTAGTVRPLTTEVRLETLAAPADDGDEGEQQ